MRKKKRKKKNRKDNQNHQINKKKVKGNAFSFPDTKSFVSWLIGMIVAYGIAIWCIVMAFKVKEDGDIAEYYVLLVVGSLFIMVLTAFLLASLSTELAAILIGIGLVLMGLVLPIVSKWYILILLLAPIWISGILIIIDNIAKLTHTTDKGYYKVIFGAAGKVVDALFDWKTRRNPKARKFDEAAVKVFDVASRVRRIVEKVGMIIMLVILLALTGINFYFLSIFSGIFTLLCALFVLFVLVKF